MSDPILTVEKLIWRGRALSRLDSGKVVLIEPGVFPGERVRVRITREKKDYLDAVCSEILNPLPERRAHPCPQAGSCPGCRFGVLPVRLQLELKKRLLLDELHRGLPGSGKSPENVPLEVFSSPRGWRYRWRGQIHVHEQRPHFRKMGSHELVPLRDCLLFVRPLGLGMNRACRGLANGKYTIAADPLEQRVAFGFERDLLALPFPEYRLQLKVPPGSFFQANWSLNQTLVAHVASCLTGFTRVADLYAGAGNFALPLAAGNAQVLALESDAAAVSACRQSAREAGLDNLRVERRDLSGIYPGSTLSGFAPEALVLDPPRTGGGKKGLASLRRLESLQRLVWVSCDLVNTCRDMRLFLEQGWKITGMALFDMFPQTWHLETVFVLDRH